LDVKIKHKTREQDMVARMAQSGTAGASEQREVERVNGSFSLSRAISAIANGRNLEGAEAEWQKEAAREMRSQGLQSAGQIAIPLSLCVLEKLTTSKQQQVATVRDSFLLLYPLQSKHCERQPYWKDSAQQ